MARKKEEVKQKKARSAKGWAGFLFRELIVPSAALAGLALAIAQQVWPGRVEVLPPAGIGLIRGLDPFPSDHLFIPLVWSNTGRRARLVRDIRLLLVPKEDGKELHFLLAGEYSEMSPRLIGSELTTMRSAILLPPTSTVERILVFHILNWWDDKGEAYNFRFTPGESYEIFLLYKLDSEDIQRQAYLCIFPGEWESIRTLPGPGPGGPVLARNWDYYDLSKIP